LSHKIVIGKYDPVVAPTLSRSVSYITRGRETGDSHKVRFAQVRETSIELRESSPILRESSDDPKSM